MLIGVMPISVYAAETTGTFGASGNNLTWKHESTTYVLDISGAGGMPTTYNTSITMANTIGWKTTYIVNIQSGVTDVSDFAFYKHSPYLHTVNIADSVKRIGLFAFYDLDATSPKGLQTITGMQGVEVIDRYAFQSTSNITSFPDLPASLHTICESAFDSALGNIGTLRNLATTPQTIGPGAFRGLGSYVPQAERKVYCYSTNTTFIAAVQALNLNHEIILLDEVELDPATCSLEDWLDEPGNTVETWVDGGGSLTNYLQNGGTVSYWTTHTGSSGTYLWMRAGGTSSGWVTYGGTAAGWTSAGGSGSDWVAAGGSTESWEDAGGDPEDLPSEDEQAVKVYVNDSIRNYSHAPARVVNGKIVVPLRALAEELGIAVTWDDTTKTAYFRKEESGDKRELIMIPNKGSVTLNGKLYPLDIPLQIIAPGYILGDASEFTAAFKSISYKQEQPSELVYEGYVYSTVEPGTELKLADVPTITEYTQNSSAVELTEDNEEELLGDEQATQGGVGIILYADPTIFSIAGPSVIYVAVLEDTSAITADNLEFINTSPAGPILLKEISYESANNWKVVDYNINFKRLKVSSKEISFMINNSKVSKDTGQIPIIGDLAEPIMPQEGRHIDIQVKVGAFKSNIEGEHTGHFKVSFDWDSI